MIEDLVRDLRHGARLLRRSPAFTAVVLATLALGIGATVTVFSIVDAWLLRPLSFPDAHRLVIGLAATRERPTEPAVFLPFRSYLGWNERSRSFETVSAAFPRAYLMSGAGDATTANGLAVTPEFFETLAVAPFLGRALSVRDADGPAAVVLSHGLWERQFGASPDVLGRLLTLNGVPHEVVGVMPRELDMRMLERPRSFDLFTLFGRDEPGRGPGGAAPVAIVGRLLEGMTIAAAQAEVVAVQHEIESGYGPDFAPFTVLLTSLQADNTRVVRATLVTVGGAVACLLLIACMNVGTLLVGRGLARTREAAVRAAIGCGRGRLVRQLLTESLLLSVVGGTGGLIFAVGATRLYARWNPLGTLPANPIQIDLRVLAVAAGLTAVATMLCGLLPALRMAATAPADALRSGGERGPAGAPAQRAQAVLLGGQIAISVVLLIATALLVRTFAGLQREPLGFNATGLVIAGIALPNDELDTGAKRNLFYRQLADRLAALPGVRRVAAGTSEPLTSGAGQQVRRGTDDSETPVRINAQDVTTEFFETMEVPLLAGRRFEARDTETSPGVVLLNERAARTLFGRPSDAVGRRIRIGAEPWRDVIGVVGDTRSTFYNTLEWQNNPVLYLPAAQAFSANRNPMAPSFGLHVHIRADRPLTMAEIKDAVALLSARVAVTQVSAAEDLVADATRQPAFRVALLTWFAAASLLLAAIGVYGIVAQGVAQRMREIGVRVALGASRRDVMRAVTFQVLLVGGIGLASGCVAALLMGNTLRAVLYGVRATDVASFASATLVLLVVTAIAAFIPALRATHIDPARVLRAD